MQTNWIKEDLLDPSIGGPSDYPPQFTPFCEQLLEAWNSDYFKLLNMEVLLCREFAGSESSYEASYAIYLTDWLKSPRVARFDAPPPEISWMEFFYPNTNDPANWFPIHHSPDVPTSPRVHFQAEIP